jgi:hypothetical protein
MAGNPPAGQRDGLGFAISVPDSWFEIELHPDTRNAAIAALVSERVRAVAALQPHRAELARALREAARNAYASGAVYCATMVEGFDGAVLTGSVTVSVAEAPGGDGQRSTIEGYLRPLPRRGDDSPWRAVEQVDLPHVGPVARTRGVEDVVLPDGAGWIRSVLLQTFVPFPGPTPDRVALITGSSPILPLTDGLFDLFDAITSTFRFIATEANPTVANPTAAPTKG